MENTNISNVCSDVLLNATDYIGNRPHCFGADNHDLDMMRNNSNFRNYVNDNVDIDSEDISDMNQELCADYVWILYRNWQGVM